MHNTCRVETDLASRHFELSQPIDQSDDSFNLARAAKELHEDKSSWFVEIMGSDHLCEILDNADSLSQVKVQMIEALAKHYGDRL